jgi:hypothetical protein
MISFFEKWIHINYFPSNKTTLTREGASATVYQTEIPASADWNFQLKAVFLEVLLSYSRKQRREFKST